MSDNLDNRGGSDRLRINLNEAYEVNYWTGKLQISREELKLAVEAVGDRAEAVEQYVTRQQAPGAGSPRGEQSTARRAH